ncbi:hypothetical protein ACS0TY_027211 [Phlomoides rotata]
MESPFFRNRRWYQQPDLTSYHPASIRGTPVYGVDPIHESHRSAYPVHRTQEINSGPKVVRIPVHFVGSEPVDRTGSAVKIQKVFRGFLVRKCLKKVKDIRVQVDEIEEKLWKSEIVELLRREKLRLNETLMSLLFKLDSICGVDFGVRGCRKAVIRKVIALQERIDAIAEGNGENDDQVTEIGVSVETNKSDHPNPTCSGGLVESGNIMEVEGDDVEAEIIDAGVSVETENSNKFDNPAGSSKNSGGIVDVGVDCEVKVGECNVENQNDDGDVNNKNDSEVNVDDSERSRELLEKMMEGCEKMTRMMSELYERNEMQTKMLNALTQRVEMLEKAFLCDRLRRRKKKKKANNKQNY